MNTEYSSYVDNGRHAVPDPRSILGVVRLILDFDLGKPRAVLPSIREYKESYKIMHYPFFSEDEDLDDEFYETEEAATWRPSDKSMATSRRKVFDLLHTCRMARIAMLETYRLAVGSEIEEENKPWWVPEEDMVLFIGSDHRERATVLHWLFRSRKESLPVFGSLQHIAVKCEHSLTNYLVTPFMDDVPHLEEESLDNFPALQSFTMFVDPASVLDRQSGKVLLHEPEQNPVHTFRGYKPDGIASSVAVGFEEVLPEDMELPLVEVFVAGWKRR
ncbi:hypothetical protein IFR04_004598 [Cadophora malorum]|uniref:Uncharacterized protein n=1 Tax=Cadophora malorum TaxID=108018 RepID=A0A8H7WCB4_9HELO|nr:hypothetical protein IFR04_004598 [Cadophora malorum]